MSSPAAAATDAATDVVPPAALCRRTDAAALPFETTADLQPLDHWPGQGRAIEAIQFGVGMRHAGYNIFALGSPGLGRRTILREFLERRAAEAETPPDWCYVHNFADPAKPRALKLPAGRGRPLRDDLARVMDELQGALPALLEGDEYRARHAALEKEIGERREQAFAGLGERAERRGLALVRTPSGLVVVPTRGGQVLEPDEFNQLPEAERGRLQAEMRAVGEELNGILAQLPAWAREHREKVRQLRREMTQAVVVHHMEEVRAKHGDLPEVAQHLSAIEEDLIENVHEFAGADGEPEPVAAQALRKLLSDEPALHRYRVNVLVDRAGKKGAPVVHEDRPSYANLVGRIEHTARLGALLTDFTLIKAGALHEANGGYLVLDVEKVLREPMAWEELKRTLRAGQIRIESLGDLLGLTSTVSLQPEPIPLDVKVVLVGRRLLYYLLAEHDPEFPDLFKVEADFDEEMDRGGESDLAYARLLAGIARKEGTRPLDRGAVARLIEEGSRLAGDAEKLSVRLHGIADRVREADRAAALAGRAVVSAADVEAAIEAARRRGGRLAERIVEEIRRGTIVIETKGARAGTVNGLSVISLGRNAFGRPSRITARVRPGRGTVTDIEREVELGGPLHSKGVLILASWLGARYAEEVPLALGATLVFEQSYGGVDGDSASSAELYALLSALADAPIAQRFAVTGSVSQLGEVQAIGGVNEKIEGFFDVCRAKGLEGDEGVLIPAANVKHLMLRRDVVEAAEAGRFRVIPVRSIDQGIEILTGLPAGQRDPSTRRFPEGSLNARVEARLLAFAEVARSFGREKEEGAGKAR